MSLPVFAPRGFTLLALPLTLALAACPAPAGDTDSDTDAASTGGTGDDPTGGIPAEDLNPYTIGEFASQACRDAMPAAGDFLAATEAGDAAAAMAAYNGALQSYVQAIDALTMRTDDMAILDALGQGDAAGAALAEGHLLSSLAKHMRDNMISIEQGAEDKYAAWDEGHCIWEGAIKTLATRAQSAAWAAPGDPIAADIDAAFLMGHDAIGGEAPATAIDEWRFLPARQIIEKTFFRAAQRDIVHQAGVAKMTSDPVAAARALGEIGLVRDRMQDRNTPGIAQLEAMLSGDPAMISAEVVAIELDIAFAKRTLGYADRAFDDGLGVPAGLKGAVEGRTYGKLLVAGMKAAMMETDSYMADWEEYVELVRVGTDEPATRAVSDRLVAKTCEYQTLLGIATCTSTDDETQ